MTPDRLTAALADRYRIERELGHGGMATVYLAEDLKHRRKVALKVLKPELAAIVGADRFLAEIQTTATLQHPHILPLFDSGQADGFLFYVMPYVNGESLRDRLNREKQLPVGEAVRIASAVANALEHAHRLEVVHRDIKPENILLQDGEPVVADFGIALAVGAAGGGRLTETGLSLGTPYYMSPEQATGDQHIGPQADVYALGCVLYEMLVGEPPHAGPTAQAVLAKILTEVPKAPSVARPNIPENVDAVVRKAIEKLPADRFASAQDFARALSDPGFRGDRPRTATMGKTRWRTAAAVGMGLGVALGFGIREALARPKSALVERFEIVLPQDQRYGGAGGGNNLAWSPDGSRIVYAASAGGASPQLWQRPLNALEAQPIAGTEGTRTPSISPDGSSVAFTSADGDAIRTVPLSGGPAFTVATGAVGSPEWGPDGMLYFRQDESLKRVSPSGGTPETLITAESGTAFRFPDVLPEGEGILLTITRGNSAELSVIAVTTRRGAEPRILFPGMTACYVRTGHVVYVTADGTLMAVPFDLRRLEVTGSPVALFDGISIDAASGGQFAISESGALIYASASGTQLQLVRVARNGSAEVIDPTWPPAALGSPSLSPDGRRVALEITASGGRADIWVKQLDRGPLSRVTFEGSGNPAPSWSPDGKSLLYAFGRDGQRQLWTAAADGSTPAKRLLDLDADVYRGVWAPDGEWLVYRVDRPTSDQAGPTRDDDIMAVRPSQDEPPRAIAGTLFNESGEAVSPDGRWLAYRSNETGTGEIYVRPFAESGGGRWQVSTSGGREPVWGRNGRELFYRTAAGELAAADVSSSATFQAGTPRVLFSTEGYVTGGESPAYDVTPDGQHFLMLRSVGSAPTQLVVVQNFFEELKARVPR